MPHPGRRGAPTGGGGGQVGRSPWSMPTRRPAAAWPCSSGRAPPRSPSINDLASRLGSHPGRHRAGPVVRRQPGARRRRAAPGAPAATSAPSWSPTSCPPTCSSGRCARGSRTSCRPRSSRLSWPKRCARVADRARHGRPRPGRPGVIEGDGELGRVITVFSTKGGAGKSVVATNLAVVLARRSRSPVVLVDADLQFGDIAVMLKLSPQHTDRRRGRRPRPARPAAAAEPARSTPRAVGPAGAAGPARAGLRRPDRRRARWSRIVEMLRTLLLVRRRRHAGLLQRRGAGPHRDQRRRAARRRHGHPEHQERQDRPADPAPAQHADVEAPPGAQPGQLQGEARRRRGRAHARIKADVAHPERRRRPPVRQQGRAGRPRRPEVRRRQVHRAAGRPLPAPPPPSGRSADPPIRPGASEEEAEMSLYKRLHEVQGGAVRPERAAATPCSTSCARRSTTT